MVRTGKHIDVTSGTWPSHPVRRSGPRAPEDLRAGAPPERMAPDVDQLLAGTRQLGEEVEDLLLSTQLQTGTEAGAEVALGVVAAGVVATLGTRAREQGVDLALVPDPDEPSV